MDARAMMMQQRLGVLHVHSNYSRDGRDSLEALRAFALQRDLSFIALSDHAEDFDRGRFGEYVARCEDLSDGHVVLIPGLEFRFAERAGLHLLALGITRWLAPRRVAEFVPAARAAGARLTVAAHPVLFGYSLPPSVRAGIDGIEVWNAAYNTRYLPDPSAIRLFLDVQRDRPDIVATAGLDQHDARNDREVRVAVPADEHDPLSAIRTGRSRNIGRTMTFDARLRWGPFRLGTLAAVRRVFDGIERCQDRWARRRAVA